jgi:hypothetical protein
MSSYSREEITGSGKARGAWRVKTAHFLATPFIVILSIIRIVLRVDVRISFATPGTYHKLDTEKDNFILAGAMMVKYYDDVQIVEAVEPGFEGRDAGYVMPPMHDAFLRAARAMAKTPSIVAHLNNLGIHAELVHGAKSENDNDSRSNA